MVLGNLGMVCGWQGRDLEALEFDRQVMPIAESLAAEFPNDRDIQEGYANSLGNLASSLDKTERGQRGESDALMLKAFEIREKLFDRNSDDIGYVTQYLNLLEAVWVRLVRQHKSDAAELLRECAAARVALVAKLHGASPPVASKVANHLSINVAQFIERGDHRRAADCLDKYPPRARQFLSDALRRSRSCPRATSGHHCGPSLRSMHAVADAGALLQNCVDLARVDANLAPNERDELIRKYTTLAKQFQYEADLAIDAWLNALAPDEDAGAFRLAFHGEKLVNDWLTFRGGLNGSDVVPKHLRDAYCWSDELMLRRLLERSANSNREAAEAILSCADAVGGPGGTARHRPGDYAGRAQHRVDAKQRSSSRIARLGAVSRRSVASMRRRLSQLEGSRIGIDSQERRTAFNLGDGTLETWAVAEAAHPLRARGRAPGRVRTA